MPFFKEVAPAYSGFLLNRAEEPGKKEASYSFVKSDPGARKYDLTSSSNQPIRASRKETRFSQSVASLGNNQENVSVVCDRGLTRSVVPDHYPTLTFFTKASFTRSLFNSIIVTICVTSRLVNACFVFPRKRTV
ncbi:hypothetical protein Bbelb_323190 [Branchiostoma belcheri]|nr:hypothetical protein Bbelb_323190 [Branchiostoma belcheri]